MQPTGSAAAIVAGSFALGIAALVAAATVRFGHPGVSVVVYLAAAVAAGAGIGAVRRIRWCSALCAVMAPVTVFALLWLAEVHGDDGYRSGKGEPSDASVELFLVGLLLILPALATVVLGIVGAAVARRR